VLVRINHEPPPLFQSFDTPTTINTPSSINKFDEAVADAFATCNTMGTKFESMMAAFEQACTTLQCENQEFHSQLLIDMQTFQMNMFPRVVTCQQNTINCATDYQTTSQQALEAQAQFSLPKLSMEQQIPANLPILYALDTAPSCSDVLLTSTAHSDDAKLATKPYSCNPTGYPAMSTRSISMNISPCIRKITLHPALHVVFGYVSLSNFSYADPPLLQPHCLNLPPSRAKKKGV